MAWVERPSAWAQGQARLPISLSSMRTYAHPDGSARDLNRVWPDTDQTPPLTESGAGPGKLRRFRYRHPVSASGEEHGWLDARNHSAWRWSRLPTADRERPTRRASQRTRETRHAPCAYSSRDGQRFFPIGRRTRSTENHFSSPYRPQRRTLELLRTRSEIGTEGSPWGNGPGHCRRHRLSTGSETFSFTHGPRHEQTP